MGEGLHYEEKIHSLLIRSDVILYGFPFGNSQVDAAETDTSNVTYKYIDISTLTETQKNSIIKGKPNETLTNDYENYSFVYQKNTSGPTTNTDNTSDNNKDQNGTLLKAGDVGPNIYLVILGFILLGSGIGLLTLKKDTPSSY